MDGGPLLVRPDPGALGRAEITKWKRSDTNSSLNAIAEDVEIDDPGTAGTDSEHAVSLQKFGRCV